MKIKLFIVIVAVTTFNFLLGTLNCSAQTGSLDATFSSDGKVITPIGSGRDRSFSAAIQSDGKIVVAGTSYNGTNYDFAVVRYNNNGTLDSTFDTDGKVTTDIGGLDDYGNLVVIQSDDKIVVAGHSDNSSYVGDFALVRYNSDGTLDSTFDTDGKVNTDIGSFDNRSHSVAIQSDGKIVVAGYINNSAASTNDYFALARYNSNGSLDSTFSSDGIVTTAIGSNAGSNVDDGYSVAIQSDDKIIVAGLSHNGTNYDFALVRYNSNGTLDNSFSSDGKVTTDIGGLDDKGLSVAIQSDGKIVVAGQSNNGTNYDFALVRYNINGTLDSTFNTDGKATTDIGGFDDYGGPVAIQSDGKIVMTGNSNNGSSDLDFALVRYNSDGTLDNTFDTDGKVTTDIGNSIDSGYSIVIQNDGKIVVAGTSNNSPTEDFVVVRYNNVLVGIEEAGNGQWAVKVFPNPNSGVFRITNDGLRMTNIEIYNVLGEKVYSSIIDYESSIINLNVSTGIYFIKIISGENIYAHKIIIQ